MKTKKRKCKFVISCGNPFEAGLMLFGTFNSADEAQHWAESARLNEEPDGFIVVKIFAPYTIGGR